MKPWRVILHGVDITRKVSRVQTRAAAENICLEAEVTIADPSVLDGIVVPRVPQTLAIEVDALVGGSWVSRGAYYLEQIGHGLESNAHLATVWGRSLSARLTTPWGQKISRQWGVATTIGEIFEELSAMCGVVISIQNDFQICQYCYAVSDWYPSQIIQDLVEKNDQICWPQVDGSLLIAPRLYRDLPAPVVVLEADQVDVQGVRRQVPDFGNRVLISGDVSVAGISIQVVTLYDEDQCVAADGESMVRLVAVVLGVDGAPVADGTVVEWSCSAGRMIEATSEVGSTMVVGEQQRATSYTTVSLDLPASSVVGVYAYGDVRRATNLYTLLGGSVSSREIKFAAALKYFDQALVIDYIVTGAEATWEAGWKPGDVTVWAAVAGAQGTATIHQSNPSACASSIVLEASPSSPCLGDVVAILAKVTMFGGPGIGPIMARLEGCGSLTSTRKTLGVNPIVETLRTTQWGGVSQVRLSAIPAQGTTPSVVLAETPAGNLYLSHDRQTLLLSQQLLPGTQIVVTYQAAGTAILGWKSASVPSGHESIAETLAVAHAEVEGVTVAQVTLSRTPIAAPICIPDTKITDFYGSHAAKVVTLMQDSGVVLPVGTQVECTYQSPWMTQPGCSGIVTVTVQDGSQDGGTATITVTARDCREVVDPEDYDPEDPDQIPDESTGPSETGDNDPTSWLEPEEEQVTPTGCGKESVNRRTPVITSQNYAEVFGVPSIENCDENGQGVCTCDEICTALRATGRLSTEGNMTYSTCMQACEDTREAKCGGCTLSGPSTLAPGENGVWTDGKTNSGEVTGDLTPVSRNYETGYTLKMPTGGSGEFKVRVCYGEDERTCCEAQVSWPPCSISGPSSLAQGQEGEFVPSLGMTGAGATPKNMDIVRTTDKAIVAKLAAGACEGSIEVYYGGRKCGKQTIEDSYADTVGVVVGESYLEPGETAYYAHSLGAGATYTGDLIVVSQNASGAVLQMPEDAAGSYVASWSGRCGVSASMTVGQMPCNGDFSDEGYVIADGVRYTLGSYINTQWALGASGGSGYTPMLPNGGVPATAAGPAAVVVSRGGLWVRDESTTWSQSYGVYVSNFRVYNVVSSEAVPGCVE